MSNPTSSATNIDNSNVNSGPTVPMQASLYCQMIAGQDNPVVNILFMHEGASLHAPSSELAPAASSSGFHPYSKFDRADNLLAEAYILQAQNLTPHLLLQETEGAKGNKQAITSCRVWVLDIDSPISQEQLVALAQKIPPSFITETSPGKYHLYYLTERGARFANSVGATRPEDRFYYFIEMQRALLGAALLLGYDADINYVQITKRCRIPGFIRSLGVPKEVENGSEEHERFIPKIVWASAGQASDVTRYTHSSLLAVLGEENYRSALEHFGFEVARRKDERRKASRELVRKSLSASGASGIPPQTVVGEFDFTHIATIDQLFDADHCALSYPGAMSGSRNDTLFRFMYTLAVHAGTLLSSALASAGASNIETDWDLIDLLTAVAVVCDSKHDDSLGDDEVEQVVLSAFEYATKTLADTRKRKADSRELATSTPVPASVSESIAQKVAEFEFVRTFAGYSTGSGKAYDYDRTTINPAAPFDDASVADRMVQRFGSVIRRVGDKKQLSVFDGRVWVLDKPSVRQALYTNYLTVVADIPFEDAFVAYITDRQGNPSATKAQQLCQSLGSFRRFEQVISAVQTSDRIESAGVEEFTEAPEILNCLNGVLNLKTGELNGHSPEYYCKAVAGVSWQGESPAAPLWHDYLESVFGPGIAGDKLRNYVQRLCGYLISGHMDEQVMVLLYGAGSNGKSVLTKVLSALLGSYAGVGDESDFGAGKKNSMGSGKLSERVMAKFVGKRLVLGSEFSKGTRLREEAVKRITAGEACPARFLYGEAFEVRPTFKMVIGTNHLPSFEDDTNAIWRRVHIIPFEFSFLNEREQVQFKNYVPADSMRERVLGLEDKIIAAELPGVLAWCVQGYWMWREQGLTNYPEVIEKEVASAKFDANMSMEILAECVVPLTDRDMLAGQVGVTSSMIVQEIKRVVVEQTGMNPNEFKLSPAEVGKHLKNIRGFTKKSTRGANGKFANVYPVRLDFNRVSHLDN